MDLLSDQTWDLVSDWISNQILDWVKRLSSQGEWTDDAVSQSVIRDAKSHLKSTDANMAPET